MKFCNTLVDLRVVLQQRKSKKDTDKIPLCTNICHMFTPKTGAANIRTMMSLVKLRKTVWHLLKIFCRSQLKPFSFWAGKFIVHCEKSTTNDSTNNCYIRNRAAQISPYNRSCNITAKSLTNKTKTDCS